MNKYYIYYTVYYSDCTASQSSIIESSSLEIAKNKLIIYMRNIPIVIDKIYKMELIEDNKLSNIGVN